MITAEDYKKLKEEQSDFYVNVLAKDEHNLELLKKKHKYSSKGKDMLYSMPLKELEKVMDSYDSPRAKHFIKNIYDYRLKVDNCLNEDKGK